MNSPTLDLSVPPLALLSLNWVMRPASPKPVRQLKTQASCVCSGTWLWQNSADRSGSTPAARSCAADAWVRALRAAGSGCTVSAWRSAMK